MYPYCLGSAFQRRSPDEASSQRKTANAVLWDVHSGSSPKIYSEGTRISPIPLGRKASV